MTSRIIGIAALAAFSASVSPTPAAVVCQNDCSGSECIQICAEAPPIKVQTEGAPARPAAIPRIAKAVMDGEVEELAREVAANPDDVNRAVRAEGRRAGFTPVILAVALGRPDMLAYLLSHGANVAALDDYRRSALWYAALQDDGTSLRILLENPGAREIVNAADADPKRTPLHLAVQNDDAEVTSALLHAGANRELEDAQGRTAEQYCKINPTGGCQPF